MSKKLNSTQISALSSKIYREIKAEYDKHRVNTTDVLAFIDTLPEDIKQATETYLEALDQLETLQEAFKNVLARQGVSVYTSNFGPTQTHVKNALAQYFNRNLKSLPGEDTIKQDIILATIDHDSVEEIVNKIKEKYTVC